MTLLQSLLVLTLIYLFGQFVNRLTKGWISSTLVVVIFMLLGFLSGVLPKNIVETSNLSYVYKIFSAIIITNIGTMVEPAKFKVYWRVVVSCIAGLVGLAVLVLGVGGAIFGMESAWAVFPTLTGSLQATRLMTTALNELGKVGLIGLVTIIQSAQGWVGIPAITIGTRMECERSLKKYRAGDIENTIKYNQQNKTYLIDKLPKKWDSPFIHLAILVALSTAAEALATITAPLTMNIVGSTILGLVFGCAFRQLGLICKTPLAKVGLMDVGLFAIIIGVYANLANITAEDLLATVAPVIVYVLLGAVGLSVCAVFVGRLLKIPAGIAIAAVFGAYQGFPVNYQVANDTINVMTDDENERAYLRGQILENVVMGSITSVTVLSLIIASVVIGLFFS